MADKSNKNKGKYNNTFQKIKDRIIQDNDKKIVVIQKKNKKKGNYIFEETIGHGAFAKVKLAKHIHTGEKVAIKILNKEEIYKSENESDIKKIKKEINILQRLKHKNIIQLYEIMETNKNLYIVMEYCEGKELFEYIVNRKHLTEREACRYFQQIINGVEYLHLSNVTHRDLKPENLLLDNKKRILISDFGLSILSKNYNELLSTPCGTPSYAPPEMLKGKKYNGICSDIWSCGIILYTMLVGNLPCSDSKEEIVYQNIITHNFFYPENLSDDAIDLIEHLLKINPEERYNFDEIKAHPWFNILTPKLRPGIVFGVHKIPIDNKILDKVEEYGYDRKEVEESVIESKYDSLSAVYYLILKKFKKDGINSISDLFSDDYLSYLKNYKNWINPSKINDPLFKDYEVELLDTLDEDEMLWSPQADSPNELSNISPNMNIKNTITNNHSLNDKNIKDSSNKITENIFEQKDFEENLERDLSNDKFINDIEINFSFKNNNNDNIKNSDNSKIKKTPKRKNDKNNFKKSYKKNLNINELSPRNAVFDLRKKYVNDSTNIKYKDKKSIFNLKNKNAPFSLESIIKKRILNEKDTETEEANNNKNEKNNTNNNQITNTNNTENNLAISMNQKYNTDINKTLSKSMLKPDSSNTNKNKNNISPDKKDIDNSNKKLSLYDQIIFDNLNELEAESKFLSQTSEILNENINEKKSLMNLKFDENKEKSVSDKNNKIRVEFSPLRFKSDKISLSNERNINNEFTDLIGITSSTKSNNLKIRNTSTDNYSIRIKRAKKKPNEKMVLLSEELSENKKEEILNKLREEEKKFDDELKAIDDITLFNPIKSFDINNNEEKSIVGQIAEKLIKTTIFSKYLIGHKKHKNSLKLDIENQFYILQKYKNIIGLIERMRNKMFTKKVNDFNFYTFDEYLNDENDKMFVKSLLKIPYFNSFIQKAKNTLYQKDAMTKRTLSKNYTIKPHKFNLNKSHVLISYLTSNSNNICFTSRDYPKPIMKKLSSKLTDIRGLDLNLSFSPDKSYLVNYKNKRENFNLYKVVPNTTRSSGKNFDYNKSKSYSKGKNTNINYTYDHNSMGKGPNKPNSNKNRNLNDLNNNKKILYEKNYMNDISENEESFSSSYSSISNNNKKDKLDKKNIKIITQRTAHKFLHTSKFSEFKNKRGNAEVKLNSKTNRNIYKSPISHIDRKKKFYISSESVDKNNKNNNRYNNCVGTLSPNINKKQINAQLLTDKKEPEKNIDDIIRKTDSLKITNINLKKYKSNNFETLKELKEFTPIDLNYILNIPINIIIQKTKKFFKKNGYFCNEKNNSLKAIKGSSIVEIALNKLPYLVDDKHIYYSAKIKNKDLKNQKLFLKELIYYLKK